MKGLKVVGIPVYCIECGKYIGETIKERGVATVYGVSYQWCPKRPCDRLMEQLPDDDDEKPQNQPLPRH